MGDSQRSQQRSGPGGAAVSETVGDPHHCDCAEPGRGRRGRVAEGIIPLGRHASRHGGGIPGIPVRGAGAAMDRRRPGTGAVGVELRRGPRRGRHGAGPKPGRVHGHVRGDEPAADAGGRQRVDFPGLDSPWLLAEPVGGRASDGEDPPGRGGSLLDPPGGVYDRANGRGALELGHATRGPGGGREWDVGGVPSGKGHVHLRGYMKSCWGCRVRKGSG